MCVDTDEGDKELVPLFQRLRIRSGSTLSLVWGAHSQVVTVDVHQQMGTLGELTRDQAPSDACFQFVLKISFHWPRSIDRIVSLFGNVVSSGFGDLKVDASVNESMPYVLENEADDDLDLRKCERFEQNHIVDPIQKLRAEVNTQMPHHVFANLLWDLSTRVAEAFLQMCRADVGGHDHDRVLEIDRLAL